MRLTFRIEADLNNFDLINTPSLASYREVLNTLKMAISYYRKMAMAKPSIASLYQNCFGHL